MVTYGKTLGGGLPVGVLCGRKHLMKRFREDRPADVCFARGTFNSHPYVMGAMHEFLRALETPEMRAKYAGSTRSGTRARERLNQRLREAGLPLRVANFSSVWTVMLHAAVALQLDAAVLPARGRAGAELGGHRAAHLPHRPARRDFAEIAGRIVAAAAAMQRDGWWWSRPGAHESSDPASRADVRALRPRVGLLPRASGRSAPRAAGRAAPSTA